MNLIIIFHILQYTSYSRLKIFEVMKELKEKKLARCKRKLMTLFQTPCKDVLVNVDIPTSSGARVSFRACDAIMVTS